MISSASDFPLVSTQPNYAPANNFILPNPTFTGPSLLISWGDTTGTENSALRLDTGTTAPSFDFTGLDSALAVNIIPNKGRFNLIVQPAFLGVGGTINSATPLYIYRQDYADSVYLTYAAGLVVIPGWYICLNGTCPGTGQYWQVTSTTISGVSATCALAGTTTFPSSPIVGQTVTDSCATFAYVGPHAPPQDTAFSSTYKGHGYSLTVASGSQSGTTGTVTASGFAPTWKSGDLVTVAFASDPRLNCTNCAVVGTPTATTVSYQMATSAVINSEVCTGACTISGKHSANINSANATPALLATGLAVCYELPCTTAMKNLMLRVLEHYSANCASGTEPPCSGNAGNNGPALGKFLGYVRFGLQHGGENVVDDPSVWSTFALTSTAFKPIYLSWVNSMDQYENVTNLANANVWLNGNLYTNVNPATSAPDTDFPDFEATYAVQNNIGIDQNGLNSADMTAGGVPPNCAAGPNVNVTGDLVYNWCKYIVPTVAGQCKYKMPNGQCAWGTLQTQSCSTPGIASGTQGGTSCSSGSYSPIPGFIGLAAWASLLHNTNLEVYTSDLLQGFDLTPTALQCPQCSTPFQLPYFESYATFRNSPELIQAGNWGSGATGGAFTIAPVPLVNLPTIGVANHECDSSFTYELSLPNTWVTSAAPGWPAHLPYALSQTGIQLAVNDMEAYRTANNVGIKLDIPPGVYSGSAPLTLPQTSTTASSSSHCLILASTQDSNLPNGRTVCSHGIQDNLASSTDPGVENFDCTGTQMTYQLGTTVTPIPVGTFTLANGTVTNTSAYNDVQFMWTWEITGVNKPVIQVCSPIGVSGTSVPPLCGATVIGPDHWLIMDAEGRPQAGLITNADIFSVGQTGTETATTQFASHIHWRKDWGHGDWAHTVAGLSVGINAIGRVFFLSCFNCSIVDSYASEAITPGAEGHIVGCGMGSIFKINHNWFSGESQSVLCGGTSTPTVAGYVMGKDLEIRRNRFSFPYAWLGVLKIPAGNPHWANQSIGRKNLFEMKQGERQVIMGNILENDDNSGGQSGPESVFTVRNFDGANYLATITDLYVNSNIFRNTCEGHQVAGRSGIGGNGSGVSRGMQRVWFLNNLHYNYSVSNPGCTGVNNTGQKITTAGEHWNGTMTRDATGTVATFIATCTTDVGGNCPLGPPPLGFQQTQIQIGDHVAVTGCTVDSGFNTPANGSGVVLGAAALYGTLPSGLTVVFPNAGTPNSVDSSGNCQITNTQGYPNNLIWTHNTAVSAVTGGEVLGNQVNPSGYPYSLSGVFRDSIFTGISGWNNNNGEGTVTQGQDWDTTTLTADHLVWAGRTASKYTEYSNNTLVQQLGCFFTSAEHCTPPLSMFFPTTPYCTGATSTSSCIGFVGEMSASSLNLALPDYHGYALRSDSSFINSASDGTQMGASISAIDAAQTQKQFVCPWACTMNPQPD